MLCYLATMSTVMRVENLTKNFGSVEAVRGLTLEIPEGQCFGLLGPNGAGKTTTIEIMEGIQLPSDGKVYFRERLIKRPFDRSFKEKIGIQFQHSSLPEFITVKETLKLFASFYDNPRPLEEVIRLCSLEDLIKRDNRKLSGGQRQRLLLALAIISQPEMVFLDEPTTGLDPQARRNFWELIDRIKQENCTVLLTTHYMDEAQILCDQIAIMDHGKVIELDTPAALLANHFSGVVVELPWTEDFTRENGQQLQGFDDVQMSDHGMRIITPHLDKTIKQLLHAKITIDGLNIHKPNLEDLFLKLTGTLLRS